MSLRWDVDHEATALRRHKLDEYFAGHVLNTSFVCGNEAPCRASHSGPFYEGQLHHVGRFYDLARGPSPARVVIVGQEYGHPPARVSLADRYTMIMDSALALRFKAGHGRDARNPHMRGSTSALRLMFGVPLGVDHESEFLRVGDGSCHLFDACAIVNYLLCSAVGSDGRRRGLASSVMLSNCRSHFRRALEILEPAVVIVQGKTFWPSVRQAFDRVEPVSQSEHLHKAHLGSNTVLVASFTHPSSMFPGNWGANERTPYLQNVVQPTVELIRSLLNLHTAAG